MTFAFRQVSVDPSEGVALGGLTVGGRGQLRVAVADLRDPLAIRVCGDDGLDDRPLGPLPPEIARPETE